jgi:hypothetical protein
MARSSSATKIRADSAELDADCLGLTSRLLVGILPQGTGISLVWTPIRRNSNQIFTLGEVDFLQEFAKLLQESASVGATKGESRM